MSLQLVSPDIQAYAEAHTTPEPLTLQQLRIKTEENVYQPQMLSGHLQGTLLSMISKIVNPKFIIEIGTYTGYSAICLAQGLQPDGQLHSLDKNEETSKMAQQYINAAGLQQQITLHLGEAKTVLPLLDIKFDLAFIDADKKGYSQYYHLIKTKMASGGVILADNVLFKGEVTAPQALQSGNAQAMHAFNLEVNNDPEVEQILLPIRDGILLIRKK